MDVSVRQKEKHVNGLAYFDKVIIVKLENIPQCKVKPMISGQLQYKQCYVCMGGIDEILIDYKTDGMMCYT